MGFGVWGLGFGVWGLGLQGLGFRGIELCVFGLALRRQLLHNSSAQSELSCRVSVFDTQAHGSCWISSLSLSLSLSLSPKP